MAEDYVDHPPIPCPSCGDLITGASEVTSTPLIGDLHNAPVVCWTCGEVSVYVVSAAGAVSLREATVMELALVNRYFGEVLRRIHRLRQADTLDGETQPGTAGPPAGE